MNVIVSPVMMDRVFHVKISMNVESTPMIATRLQHVQIMMALIPVRVPTDMKVTVSLAQLLNARTLKTRPLFAFCAQIGKMDQFLGMKICGSGRQTGVPV
jgi:hypothetical protein